MRFKVYSDDSWYYLPKAHNPDKDIEYWARGWGEFSLERQLAFEKHCGKLNYDMHNNPFYQKLNGNKLKAVIKNNRLFYGIKGIEEFLYV